MIGATSTVTGMPAADSALTVSSRLAGLAARGSMVRARRASSVVTRDRHLGEALRGHRRQDVDVALHQRRLGDDGDRVVGARQHLQQRRG